MTNIGEMQLLFLYLCSNIQAMKRIVVLLLFVAVAFSCEKEYYTTIPNYPANLKLNMEDMDVLNASLAYKTFTTPRLATDRLGFGGILVINGMGTNVVNLYAYDLACPVEAQRTVRVVPDKSTAFTTATCPKCGAVFNIATGTGAPQSGTKYYLKSYSVYWDGMQYVVVN